MPDEVKGSARRGILGEQLALEYLKNIGYIAVDTRYKTRYGEIDLIVRDNKYLVFVEVKLRKSARFAEAREFVSPKKRERVRKTASIWLASNETELQPRFDVIEIYIAYGSKMPEIIHLEDAF